MRWLNLFIVCIALTSCRLTPYLNGSGEIVSKNYEPAHRINGFWLSAGGDVDNQWYIYVSGRDQNGEVRVFHIEVTKQEYDQAKVGQSWSNK